MLKNSIPIKYRWASASGKYTECGWRDVDVRASGDVREDQRISGTKRKIIRGNREMVIW